MASRYAVAASLEVFLSFDAAYQLIFYNCRRPERVAGQGARFGLSGFSSLRGLSTARDGARAGAAPWAE